MTYSVQLAVLSVLLFGAMEAQSTDDTQPTRINAVVLPSIHSSCPSANILESAKRNLSRAVQQSTPCGGPGWRPVVDLNMADPFQFCPSPWTLTLTPARSCMRPPTAAGCDSVSLTVSGGSYSHVCGRAVGYTSESPDAFADHDLTVVRGSGIDIAYLDGVSVTHGSPRQHIWSFV